MQKLKLIALNLFVLSLIILSLVFFYGQISNYSSMDTQSASSNQDAVSNHSASSSSDQNDDYSYLTTTNLASLDTLKPTQTIRPTGKVKTYTLEAREADWELMPGVKVKAVTYNGTVPGPTIEATEGDLVRITLKNSLKIATSIHWHGMHLPNKQDGVPDVTQTEIKPGQTYTYEFLAGHAGTYMYHPHINSVEQIDRGLYGAFIIHPQDNSNQPNYDKDYTFVLGGWNVAAKDIDRAKMIEAMNSVKLHNQNSGSDSPMAGMEMSNKNTPAAEKNMGEMNMNTSPKSEASGGMSMGGMDYNFWTINGKSFPATPSIKVNKGDRVRVRLINISNLAHPMHLHGTDFRVIAEDGHPLDQPYIINTIDVGPGKIFDIEFLADNPGNWIFHCHELHHTENDGLEPGGLLSLIKYEDSSSTSEPEKTMKNSSHMNM